MSNRPLVLLDPLLRRVVRRVRRAGAEVHEERLVGRDHLRVLDELDRLVGQVGRQVVAVLGHRRLLDEVVVVDEVRIPLVRLAAEEAVVALEAAADRPVALRRGHVHLVGGAQVPLAEHVRVPAALAEDLGDRRALERDVAVGVREAGRGLGDAGHAVRRVVAAGEQRRAGRRAQRGGVPVRVGQAALGEPVDVRRLDQAAPRLHRRVADVVEDDVEDARRAVGRDRLDVRLPVGDRVAVVEVDRALEAPGHAGDHGNRTGAGTSSRRGDARGRHPIGVMSRWRLSGRMSPRCPRPTERRRGRRAVRHARQRHARPARAGRAAVRRHRDGRSAGVRPVRG